MEFNVIIKDKFTGLLESCGFKIVEDIKNVVTFKSSTVTIKFCFNPMAMEYVYFISSGNEETAFENMYVEGYLNIKEEPVFGLITQDEKAELWANRKFNYFLANKDTLLTGDKTFYEGLKVYFEKVCADYNKKINTSQTDT